MTVAVNYWGVLLAGVSSMVVGAVYYAPSVYGKVWMKLAKVDEKRFDKQRNRVLPLLFLMALMTAYIMAHFVAMTRAYYDNSWLEAGLMTALWLWIGVSLTTLVVHNALDQRPPKLTIISLGNRLFSLLAMGLILGWLHP